MLDWIMPEAQDLSRVRLFCFPYAGGGASVYRNWLRESSRDLEIMGSSLAQPFCIALSEIAVICEKSSMISLCIFKVLEHENHYFPAISVR